MQKVNQIVILNGGIGSRVKSIAKNCRRDKSADAP
jgi:hypothetical protein